MIPCPAPAQCCYTAPWGVLGLCLGARPSSCLCPANLTDALWLQPQRWYCPEQLGSFAFLFQTVPIACSREGVVPRGDKVASVLCVFRSVSHLLDEMLPLKITKCVYKDSPILPASPHKSKVFLTLEKTSQPSSAITMPEQHCCCAVPGSIALCFQWQQLAGWWAAHRDGMPGFQKTPKW